MSDHFVDGPAGPIRWPHEVGPDHPYWSRGQLDYSHGLGPFHVREVGPTGGVWTRGQIGDCPPERGCPQCAVAVEVAAQEARSRAARGVVAAADRSGRCEAAVIVPVFGVDAALAFASVDSDGQIGLVLSSIPQSGRGQALAETVAARIDAHPAEIMSVSVVSLSASHTEMDTYVDAARSALADSGRTGGSRVDRWELAETAPRHRPEVGRQDALAAFDRRYQAADWALSVSEADMRQLEHQLSEHRAGRRSALDLEAGTVKDALLLAAGVAISRLDDPAAAPTVATPPIGWSIYDDPGNGGPWGRRDLY